LLPAPFRSQSLPSEIHSHHSARPLLQSRGPKLAFVAPARFHGLPHSSAPHPESDSSRHHGSLSHRPSASLLRSAFLRWPSLESSFATRRGPLLCSPRDTSS